MIFGFGRFSGRGLLALGNVEVFDVGGDVAVDVHAPSVPLFYFIVEFNLLEISLNEYFVAGIEIKFQELLARVLRNECAEASFLDHFQQVRIFFIFENLLVLVINDPFKMINVL